MARVQTQIRMNFFKNSLKKIRNSINTAQILTIFSLSQDKSKIVTNVHIYYVLFAK